MDLANIFNNEYVISTILLSLSGFIIRFSLVISGQRWANTYHHLASYIILPVVGYFITTIIKGDLALSLGMIGALSIVRFRNPVKNPFELVMFFSLITLGIIATVSRNVFILFLVFLVSVILIIKIFNDFSSKFGFSFFQSSFDDGNQIYILSIEANNKIELIANNKNLIFFDFDVDKSIFIYKLNFSDKDKLLNFKSSLENISEIKKITADLQM